MHFVCERIWIWGDQDEMFYVPNQIHMLKSYPSKVIVLEVGPLRRGLGCEGAASGMELVPL